MLGRAFQWAYWPPTHHERTPIYLTALTLFGAAAFDRSTGTAAAFILWALAFGYAAPMVRVTVAMLRAPEGHPLHTGHLLRVVTLTASSVVWFLMALGYLGHPTIGSLMVSLFWGAPLSIAIVGGFPLAASLDNGGTIEGVDAATLSGHWATLGATFRAAFAGWQSGPRSTSDWFDPDAPHQDQTRYDHAHNEQADDEEEPPPQQDIPWEDEEEPHGVRDYQDACTILGIPLTASYQDALARYRDLSKQTHPDQATSPADKIRRTDEQTRLNLAWEIVRQYHRKAS